MEIFIDKIKPNPSQPRKTFLDSELNALADALRVNGQIQPILVEKDGDGYILIAGERRLRAAKSLGWRTIRAEIRASTTGNERMVLALFVPYSMYLLSK